ncbi:MAG: DUF2892 domain-containing protein [Bdellovibrionales bacterium]
MVCNMGKTDRILRTIFGALILGAGVYFKSYWGLIGIVPIVVAAVGVCPAYIPFRISTAKSENVSHKK